MDELQPSSEWSSLAVCAAACGLASLFAPVKDWTWWSKLNACGQSACAGVIVYCFAGQRLPFGIILGLVVIMGVSGPEFMRRLLAIAQKALLGAVRSGLGNIIRQPDERSGNEEDEQSRN